MTNTFVRQKKHVKPSNVALTVVLNLCVILAAVVALFPFYMLIVDSIKGYEEKFFVWWPKNPSLWAYKYIFGPEASEAYDISILRAFWNTLKIVVPSTTIGMFFAAMAAYTFVKRDFPGKNFMFSVMMLSIMIPTTVTMFSKYMIFTMIGWGSSSLPLMIPPMFGTITLLFALRQYMYGIPTELVESARMDGANHFIIFLRIILPLAKPVIIAQWLLTFMAGYNQYEEPLLYLEGYDMTLQLIIPFFSSDISGNNIPVARAATLLAFMPMFVIYTAAQKFFAQGIMSGALKG